MLFIVDILMLELKYVVRGKGREAKVEVKVTQL